MRLVAVTEVTLMLESPLSNLGTVEPPDQDAPFVAVLDIHINKFGVLGKRILLAWQEGITGLRDRRVYAAVNGPQARCLRVNQACEFVEANKAQMAIPDRPIYLASPSRLDFVDGLAYILILL
jgi:hypothetical protein